MRFIYIIIILVYQPAEVRYAMGFLFCHNAFILLGWMQVKVFFLSPTTILLQLLLLFLLNKQEDEIYNTCIVILRTFCSFARRNPKTTDL